MQSCLFSEQQLSPNERRTRISIATATPTTTRRCHRVVTFTDDPLTTCHDGPNILPLSGQFDGYYNTNPKHDNISTLQLLRFLKLTKDIYRLKDHDAMELLRFFKSNLAEACRQLTNNDGRSNMLLNLDIPWRLQAKTIHESPGMKYLAEQKLFINYKQIFILDPSNSINVLPQLPMAELYAGRDFCIQRTFHGDNLLQVGCVLPNKQEPFEVASLLLHASDNKQLHCFRKLIDQLESYLTPLITATRSWTWDDGIYNNVMFQFSV